MKITLIQIGKTVNPCLKDLIDIYNLRIKNYISFQPIEILDIKKNKSLKDIDYLKNKEGQEVIKKLTNADYVVLLDEKGKEFTSREFAGYLQKRMNAGTKNLVFVIGGAYGFSEELYHKANDKIALSKMTFSHQLIRLIFAEQLYRAMTIINNHPYHND